MKIIILPRGSSRFPTCLRMLPDHDGSPMAVKAVEGLHVPTADLIITLLREHDERFNALEGLRRAFGDAV